MRHNRFSKAFPVPPYSLPLFVLMLLPPIALSQVAPPSAPAQTPPPNAPATLKTTVDEVSLDIVVHDKKNRPVLDLTPQDIAVTDDDSPVKLLNLRLATPAPGSSRMVTFIFDRLDETTGKGARSIADKILKAIPAQDFTFAVLCIDGRLRLVQQYTTDRALIEHAVASVTGPAAILSADAALAEKTLMTQAALPSAGQTTATPTAVSAAAREAARTTLAALTTSQRLIIDQHTPGPLAGVMALAQAERQLPGRKVVLYFTTGIQADTRAAELVQTAVAAANQAGISLYAIDMSALSLQASQQLLATVSMGAMQTAAHLNPSPTGINTPHEATPQGMITQGRNQTERFEFSGDEAAKSPVGRLATDTGGAYIPAGGSLKKPIQQLVADMTTFYVASYVPPISDYDGSFRAVAIKPLRKDLSVRSRSGYFALPPGDAAEMRPFERQLLNLFQQAPPPADIALHSHIVQFGDLPGGSTHELVVEAPIADLELRRDPNTGLFSLHATVLAQILNSSGTVIEHFSQDILQHGGLDTVEAARSEVLSFQRHFIAPPGAYTLNVAMFDANSGKSSVQKTPFDLDPLPTGPSLSDLVIVRRSEPLPVTRDMEPDSTDPLRSATGEIIANLSGVIPTGTKDVSLFFMIHPGPATLGQPALEMLVSRNGHTIGRAPLAFRQAAADTAVPYFGTLASAALKPGSYDVTIRLTQGGQTFERSHTLNIGGVTSDPAAPADAVNLAAAAQPGTTPQNAVDALQPTEVAPLIVTSAGPGATPPPPAEIDSVLEGARKRALAYATTLPNFLCVEVTNRFTDTSGTGRWKHQDTFSELLRYLNRAESRRMLEVNGQRSSRDRADLKGATSHGELGGILAAIFEPSSHATFHWKETGMAGSGTVHVFEYRVAAKDSSFGLTGDGNRQINAAFHGLISVDAATHGVRRITLIADDLPADFSIHATTLTVDYDYVAINSHDYLMPARATVSLRQGKHQAILNEMQFRDYRRYGSRARILSFAPVTSVATTTPATTPHETQTATPPPAPDK